MGPCVFLFDVVVVCVVIFVVCVVLYVLCVALSVVAWDVLCLYCGFLPSLDVPFPVIVALVDGRISSLSLYI
jgi:hypothetical protein